MSGNTALIIVDPLNEFLHPDGKLYPLLKESVVASDTVNNIVKVITAARKANVPIFYGLHQLYQDGVYDGWNYMTKNHYRNKSKEMFKKDSFGAQVYEGMQPEKGDVVVARHWNGSSFANTDLDYQLRQRDITHVVCAGMIANTCLETTARYAVELGYKVTLISDATAGYNNAVKDAVANSVWPTIVGEVLTVEEWAARLKRQSSVL